MLINYSNHTSSLWTKEQIKAASVYGCIVDVPFANVDPDASSKDIELLAKQEVDKIMSYNPKAVMCQGEMTLMYHMVKLLKENDVIVLAACSSRESQEIKQEDGTTKRVSVFKFCQFREF